MNALDLAILTDSTCGDNCWRAREETCRCSCSGRNHGILTQGGTQPERNGKINGNPYELVAVIPGRAGGECWIDVDRRISAEKNRLLNERFPGLDPYAYGNYREEKTMPVVDRKPSASQTKWAEVLAVPNACRLIWSRPAGTPYYIRGEDYKAVMVKP
jgi:hypothetical protein